MKPEDYQERREELSGWAVHVVSYKLGAEYHCTVDNLDPGARLARGRGPTRAEAERQALEKAARMLGRTRRITSGQ